jgi:hypothetical protein
MSPWLRGNFHASQEVNGPEVISNEGATDD